MLIVLGKGISKQNDQSETFRIAIENITLASRNGRHMVMGNPEDMINLSKIKNIGETVKTELLRIEKNSRQNFSYIKDFVTNYILITTYKKTDFAIPSDGKSINISLETFFNNDALARCFLICENLVDTNIFVKFSRAYAFSKRLLSLCTLTFEEVSGGGSQIADVFAEKIHYNSPVLCIIDSDKIHPNDSSSDILKKLKKVPRRDFQTIEELPARELENVIPFNYYLENADPSKKDMLRFIEFCMINSKYDFYYHIDMKKGVSKKMLNKLPDKFKDEFLKLIKDYCSKDIDISYCDKCTEKCSELCTVIEGFGDNILFTIRDGLNYESPQKIFESLSPIIYHHLESILQTTTSYGLSYSKSYAN